MEYMLLAVRPYINTFNDFISLRLINKKSAKIFMDYMSCFKFENLTYSKRTWLQIYKCSCCDIYNNNCEQLTYMVDDPPRRAIVYCPSWQCKLLALQTYLYEIYKLNKMFFFHPSIPDTSYNIPRSNPKTITFAKLRWNNVGIFNKDGDFTVYVIWNNANGETYTKWVPFNELVKRNSILKNIAFNLRGIYKNLISKKLLYTNPESLVPTI